MESSGNLFIEEDLLFFHNFDGAGQQFEQVLCKRSKTKTRHFTSSMAFSEGLCAGSIKT